MVHWGAVKVGVQKEFPHVRCIMHVESAVVLVGKGQWLDKDAAMPPEVHFGAAGLVCHQKGPHTVL